MLKKIFETAAQMQQLLEDLLKYSFAKSSEQKFEETDITVIVADIKKDMENVLLEKKATIEAAHLCRCNIIRFQFRQLFQNLISNSIKFSKPETAPHIIIKSEIVNGSKLNNEKLSVKTDYCHIIYTDNGIGFDPHYKNRIFEVFQRLHSKDEYQGSGIGLSICKKIVEHQGGRIWVESAPGSGSTFFFALPVQAKPQEVR